MKKFISAIFLLSFFYVGFSQGKKNQNTEPYPYGNPVITHMYTADASPHVMPDGRVWMVTSVDHEHGGGYSTMHKYHTFSSADMVNWVDHGEILNVWDVLGSATEPEGEDWALWAPDMVYHEGKYYLYFPVRKLFTEHGYDEQKRRTESYIAVAVSDSPDKRFTVINEKIEGTRGIDPSVFIDDDGEKYLYFGNHWGAKLKDNMKELEGEPIHMDVDDEDFMEAIWMHKRDNKYYVSYHSHYGKPIDPENPDDSERMKSTLDYGVSDNPLGPFKYGGIMNYELGVNVNEGPKYPGKEFVPWRVFQSNHGGIVEFHGNEYLFYHTSALSSWRQDSFQGPGTWTQRSVCIDLLEYDDKGNVVPVQQTLSGVEPVKIVQPYAIELLNGEVNTSDGVSIQNKIINVSGNGICEFKNVPLGTGYYYFGLNVLNTISEGKVEIRLDSPDGKLVGTILLDEFSNQVNRGRAETFIRGAKEKRDIFLVFEMGGEGEVQVSYPEFFGGAPL